MRKRVRKFVILITSLVLLSSCATVNRKPFEQFKDSVRLVNSTSSDISSTLLDISRESGVQKLSVGKELTPSKVKIIVRDESWTMEKMPQYMRLKKVNAQLYELNEVLYKYSELLGAIAGSDMDTKDLQSLSKTLNKNANSLRQTIMSESKKSNTTGILSSSALSILESYINSKRSKLLGKAINSNQAYIDSHVQLMVELVDLMKEILVKSYNDSFTQLFKDWKGANLKEASSRKIFHLNDTYISDLRRLQLLKESFMNISILHKHLSDEKQKSFLSYIKNIDYSIKRAQEFQKGLKE